MERGWCSEGRDRERLIRERVYIILKQRQKQQKIEKKTRKKYEVIIQLCFIFRRKARKQRKKNFNFSVSSISSSIKKI